MLLLYPVSTCGHTYESSNTATRTPNPPVSIHLCPAPLALPCPWYHVLSETCEGQQEREARKGSKQGKQDGGKQGRETRRGNKAGKQGRGTRRGIHGGDTRWGRCRPPHVQRSQRSKCMIRQLPWYSRTRRALFDPPTPHPIDTFARLTDAQRSALMKRIALPPRSVHQDTTVQRWREKSRSICSNRLRLWGRKRAVIRSPRKSVGCRAGYPAGPYQMPRPQPHAVQL